MFHPRIHLIFDFSLGFVEFCRFRKYLFGFAELSLGFAEFCRFRQYLFGFAELSAGFAHSYSY